HEAARPWFPHQRKDTAMHLVRGRVRSLWLFQQPEAPAQEPKVVVRLNPEYVALAGSAQGLLDIADAVYRVRCDPGKTGHPLPAPALSFEQPALGGWRRPQLRELGSRQAAPDHRANAWAYKARSIKA